MSALCVEIAQTPDQIAQAQRLRYRVFVQELGGDGPLVDHDAQLEKDRFDSFADHILLCDRSRLPGDEVVGVYRVITEAMAQKAGQFYCETEYDLTVLKESGLHLLELGRSCLHPDYRGGAGMLHLWGALADYTEDQKIDVMFGVASFHGTDLAALAQPLSFLRDRHLAHPALRVSARGDTAAPLGTLAAREIDRMSAVRQMPALIKAYLRLGATVGDGVFVDHAFNTTDICLVLERHAINGLRKTIYAGKSARD